MAVLSRFKRPEGPKKEVRLPVRPGCDEYELLADYLTQLCDLPSSVKQMTDWEADFVDRQWKRVFNERKQLFGNDVENIYKMAVKFKIATNVDPS